MELYQEKKDYSNVDLKMNEGFMVMITLLGNTMWVGVMKLRVKTIPINF